MDRYLQTLAVSVALWLLATETLPKLLVNVHCEWSVRIGRRDVES